MNCSRRGLLGLVAIGALAGCTGSGPADGGDATPEAGSEDAPGGDAQGGNGDDSAGTSLAGSCASTFGDTMQRYDVGDRELVATFSYPMGGEVTLEQDDPNSYGTVISYGEGELSALHSVTVFENGPTDRPLDITEARDVRDGEAVSSLATFGGEERPVIVRRRDDTAVTYLFHGEGPDGVYIYDVTTAAGESEGCPEVYESVTRRVAESFELLA